MNAEMNQAILDAERARDDYATHGPAKTGIAIDLAGALAGLLAALSTPPADDVREVAEQALTMLALFRPWMVAPQQIENLRSILAPLLSAEVRPRGTVTDAEVNAALKSYWGASDGLSDSEFEDMRTALEAAREARS